MSTPLLETRAHLEQMKTMLETMKKQQQMRGLEQLNKRMAERVAKGNSWRQLKGIDSIMYEIKHPGNVHTVVGLGIFSVVAFSLYFNARKSEEAKKNSVYWQRFHANKEDHGHHH